MSEVPTGWVKAKIGAIARIETGSTPPKKNASHYGRDICFFKPGDLDSGGLLEFSEDMVTTKGAAAGRLLPPNTVLVTCIGNLGKSGIISAPSICNQQINAILPTPVASPWFIYYWTRTIGSWLEENSSATTISIINKGRFSQAPISIPPLPEQHRIVTKLDSMTGRTARAREQLGRIPRLIQKYRDAILAAAFSGGLTHVKGVKNVPLSEYVATLDQGWSPRCESESSDEPTEWAIIKTTAIQPIHFLASENKKLPPNLQPRPQIQVQDGDVLITRAGPRSRVGITCVVHSVRPRLMLCDKAYRIRVKNDRADPSFIAMMLNAPQSLSQIESMKTGISDSGLNLTQGKFLNLSLPKLTRSQQQEIVLRVETAFAWLDRVATEHANASRLLPKLDQAILAKAFRGELVLSDGQSGPLAAAERV
jgi:type I restriction enzyme, S subunit